jgi:hypothetical protein
MAGGNYTQRSHKLRFSEEGKTQFVTVGMRLPQLDVLFVLGWESGPRKNVGFGIKKAPDFVENRELSHSICRFFCALAKP